MNKKEIKLKEGILVSYFSIVDTYVDLEKTIDRNKVVPYHNKIQTDKTKHETCRKIKLVLDKKINLNDVKIEDIE